MSEYKLCVACSKELPIDNFYYNKSKADYKGVCKKCTVEREMAKRRGEKITPLPRKRNYSTKKKIVDETGTYLLSNNTRIYITPHKPSYDFMKKYKHTTEDCRRQLVKDKFMETGEVELIYILYQDKQIVQKLLKKWKAERKELQENSY